MLILSYLLHYLCNSRLEMYPCNFFGTRSPSISNQLLAFWRQESSTLIRPYL